MTVKIKFLKNVDRKRWDEYVDKSELSTFFHLSGWKEVLESSFGHRAHYLYAEEDGELTGVLPLMHIKSYLFGNNLVSLPFCVYGGIVATCVRSEQRLREEACALARRLNVGSLEIRNFGHKTTQWPQKNLYVTFRGKIDSDPDKIIGLIPNKQRAVVRKGIKADLTAVEGWHGRRMHRLYAESVRDLGTPVFSEKFFHELRRVFGENCRSLIVQHQGRDVSGVLSFYFKDQILPYYAGSTAAARDLYAHGFMYWKLMKNASEQGVNIFDFGRSKVNTGSYNFKKNWGFTPEPLTYEYYLVKSQSIPEINPTNPKYQVFIKAWRKLPLPIANCFGPILSRNLG